MSFIYRFLRALALDIQTQAFESQEACYLLKIRLLCIRRVWVFKTVVSTMSLKNYLGMWWLYLCSLLGAFPETINLSLEFRFKRGKMGGR